MLPNFSVHRVYKRVYKRVFDGIQKRFFKTEQDRVFDRWFSDRGDQTLRLQYNLTADSLVFDLGGYRGEWAQKIHDLYHCRVFVFEPVPAFAAGIRALFRDNPKIKVFEFGLGAKDETTQIHLAHDATSQFADGRSGLFSAGLISEGAPQAQNIAIKSFTQFLKDHGIKHIDLIKINVEGAEYEILENLLDAGIVPAITDLQIQFHDFVPNAPERRAKIRARLAPTHQTTYDYPFVWENWRRLP